MPKKTKKASEPGRPKKRAVKKKPSSKTAAKAEFIRPGTFSIEPKAVSTKKDSVSSEPEQLSDETVVIEAEETEEIDETNKDSSNLDHADDKLVESDQPIEEEGEDKPTEEAEQQAEEPVTTDKEDKKEVDSEEDIKKLVRIRAGRYIVWLIVIVILVSIAIVLALNYNLRASITGSNLRQYTVTNKSGNRYSILFYAGSKEEQYTYSPGNTQKVLVSPPINNNGAAMIISLAGYAGNNNPNAQQALAKSNSCTLTSIASEKAFSVNIPSVGTIANFCANVPKDPIGNLVYSSVFANKNSVYAIDISPFDPGSVVNTSVINKFKNTKPKKEDIKAIAASFRYLGQQK